MGFNFQAAHPANVFGPKSTVEAHLRERFGNDVPLGNTNVDYCLRDEIGWSWWADLQALAVDTLGSEGARQIMAADAWMAVYLDVDVEREVLWPDGQSDEPLQPHIGYIAGESFFTRMLRRVGLLKSPEIPPELAEALQEFCQSYGARNGEAQALQVGNLRGLMSELNALAAALGIEQNEAAIEALRRSYSEDDERFEDDLGIQCLCHAWLTASYAIANRAPLWLVK